MRGSSYPCIAALRKLDSSKARGNNLAVREFVYVPAVNCVLWLRWRWYIVPGNAIKALLRDVAMNMLFLVLWSVYIRVIRESRGQDPYTT
jgi:hypothetical protein